ncbi:MAG: tetratricopeptide repeat protein [Candidatus Binataceae bacterium]
MNISRWGGFRVVGRWNLNAKQTTALMGVLLVTLLIYLRCLSNDFVSDDHKEILTNGFIGQWSLLWRSLVHDSMWFSLGQSCYYRPLKNLWTAFNFHLFGLHPAGWHALKILLHLSVTLLSFRAAQLLTDDVAAGLATALLFGLLPAHTEVVAYISATPEPLAAVFELAALCAFIQRIQQSPWSYLLPLMLFAGALLSFEGAIVFPLLIAAYVFLFETTAAPPSAMRAGNRLLTAFHRSAPFIVLAFVYFVARSEIVGLSGFPGAEMARGPHVAFVQLLATLPSMILSYVEILIFPSMVGPVHRITWVNGFGSIHFYLALSILIFIAVATYLVFRQSSRKHLYLFCTFWSVLSLLPMLNVVMTVDHRLLPQVVQDRYLYLPSFGVCLLAGDLISRVGHSYRAIRLPLAGLVTEASMLFATVIWNAQGFWHDSGAMLRREIELVPDSPIYHRNMALLLNEEGDLTGAEREEMIAVHLDPDSDAEKFFLGAIQQRLASKTRASQNLMELDDSRLLRRPPSGKAQEP